MPLPDQPTFQWRIREYTDGLRREMLRRTYRAAAHVQQKTQRNLRVPFYTEGPSKPGEFPRARSVLLLKSVQIKVEPNTLRGWVYSNLSYALFLEFSTRTLFGREFLRRTLYEERDRVKQIFQAKLPAGLAGGGRLLLGK